MGREHISYMQRIDEARIRRERQHSKLMPLQICALLGRLEEKLDSARKSHSAFDTFNTMVFKLRKPIRTRRYDALVRLAEMYKNDGDGESVLAVRARESLRRANNGQMRNVIGLLGKPAVTPKLK